MIDSKNERYMIISGYTVLYSGIRTLNEGIKKLRSLEWVSPEPILVKEVAHAKEIV